MVYIQTREPPLLRPLNAGGLEMPVPDVQARAAPSLSRLSDGCVYAKLHISDVTWTSGLEMARVRSSHEGGIFYWALHTEAEGLPVRIFHAWPAY
jgi:hypothetical protein